MSVKRTTLLKRRKIAIIVTAIAVAVLAVALYFVWDFVKSVKVEVQIQGGKKFKVESLSIVFRIKDMI